MGWRKVLEKAALFWPLLWLVGGACFFLRRSEHLRGLEPRFAMAQLLDGPDVQAIALAQIPREEFRLRGAAGFSGQFGTEVAGVR